jgi:long-subunit acyl-CoA synthetase (AMP-forming)
MKLFARIQHNAVIQPESLAIQGSLLSLTYAELGQALKQLKLQLQELGAATLALDLDNGPAWALFDLAAMACGITLVPLPPFFSPAQLRHALTAAGVEMIISDRVESLQHCLPDLVLKPQTELKVCGRPFSGLSTALPTRELPLEISKITFTSGTTADPKGVMLKWAQMEAVVESLAESVAVVKDDRHVVLSPLAVLLENIAGLYVPLWAGASVALPSMKETGLLGAASLDVQVMLKALNVYRATTAIFSPQMLQGVVTALKSGAPHPKSLRFIAVGGAAVSERLLEQVLELKLPVYQGYGLSEFSSVVCLNRAGSQRIGSVGRPLKHVELRIADNGEVLIRGNRFSGYLGEPLQAREMDWWRSGDMGHIDQAGYLHLHGRRRDIFITAYGRNVSPEWVERELVLEPAIAQAVLFGEARPWNSAVIVSATNSSALDINAAIQRVNALLPDYARIGQWIPADAPFSLENGQLSGTGGRRREVIFQNYQERINALYQEELV